jgi:hypothetical protein
MKKISWNQILMYICFIYSGISFEFVYIQLLPLLSNFEAYAMPPPPFIYDAVYKTSPSYAWYIVMVVLLGSIVSLLAGINLYNINKQKQKITISEKWIDNITNSDEKKIISLLKENNNVLTQSQIVKESRLSKVKIHRIILKLQSNNIIEKFKYGQTNKIRLKNI